MKYLKAFWLGFLEGDGDMGRTWRDPRMNEAYDWGRSLRRGSRDR